MLRPTHFLLALVFAPSLAFAQQPPPPPPTVGGLKIDVAKATPMPQGIRDLLVFRGAPAVARMEGGRPGGGPPPPVKGLSSADKLALIRRASPTSAGTSVDSHVMLSRATMRIEGRGELTFWQAQNVTQASTIIGAQSQRGAVELVIYPEAAGRLYLAEWNVSGNLAPGGANNCRLLGSGDAEQTFRMSGDEGTIIPMAFESASSGPHGFRLECSSPWRFNSVEVSVLR